MRRSALLHLATTAVVVTMGWMLSAYLYRAGNDQTLRVRHEQVAIIVFLFSLVAAWFTWTWLRSKRRAEAKVQSLTSELEMMASVAQHTGNAVIVTDVNHRIIWVNEAFTRVTEYTADEVKGRMPKDILRSPNADAETQAQVDRVIADHAGLDIEVLHRYKNGRDRWIQMLLSPIADSRGHFTGFVSVLVDIDEKIRIREALRTALRDSEALMQTLNAHAIVSETDAQGRITRVNPNFEKLCGYREAELLGRTHALMNSDVHPPEFWARMWDGITRGHSWSGDICNRAPDGRLYWLHSLIVPFMDSQGRVEKYVSICSDITASKEAEANLRASEEMLAHTSRIARIGGWHVDLLTHALHVSDECRHILSIPQDQPVDLTALLNRFFPASREKVRADLDAVMSIHAVSLDVVGEVRGIQPDEKRWVRLFGEVDWRDPRASRLVGAVQDITFEVEAKRRIEEEERILRGAIDAVGEAFVLFDPSDRLIFCNDKYRELYSPIKEEIYVGAAYENIVRAATRHGIFKASKGHEEEWVVDSLVQHSKQHSDRIRETSDGRWIRIIERRTFDGYYVGFRIDVTDLQRARQTADAAARSKGQFLANMSHEIRTPLNAILGMLQMLLYTPLAADQETMVRKVQSAAHSLLAILNDILDFSKVEAGKMQLHPEPFSLDALLRDLSVILAGTLGEKPLELIYDVDADIPDTLVGDALRLKQVLINLGGNAIKFTASGEVVLRLRLLERGDGRVRIEFAVVDSGIGIGEEQRAHIFSGFSQAEASTARRFGGTGLGLAISQRLVALMGGALELSSTRNVGSTFSFTLDLPVALPDETEAVSGLSALLVVQQPRFQGALQRMVEGMGCQGHVVQTVTEASAWLQEQARSGRVPDVVLLDSAALSDGPPAPVIDQLRARLAPQLPSPKFVLLASGHEALQPAWKSGLDGAADVALLVKPITAGMLCEIVAHGCQATVLRMRSRAGEVDGLRLGGLRLLLVEDNAINQEVARALLQREGATVTVADNGQKGVEALLATPTAYDLVLMDMQMPVLDGLQATQAIRRLPQFRKLPIIAMTANAMQADREACLAAGMNEHVGKPFELATLVALIQRYTGRADTPPLSARVVADPRPPARGTAIFDAAAATHRLGGDQAFLRRLVAAFQDRATATLQQVRQAMQQGDSTTAAALLHQFKSHAGTVGADVLAEASASFERALRASGKGRMSTDGTSELLAQLDLLERACRDAVLAQQQWLRADEVSAEALPAVSSEAGREMLLALQALKELLVHADMEAIEVHEKLLARYPIANSPLFADLNEAMAVLDMPSALAQATALIERLHAGGLA